MHIQVGNGRKAGKELQSSFYNVLSVALAGGQGISSPYMIRPSGTRTWWSVAGRCSCVPDSDHLPEAYTGLGSSFKIEPHAIWHPKMCPYAKLNCKSGNNFHRKCWEKKTGYHIIRHSLSRFVRVG